MSRRRNRPLIFIDFALELTGKDEFFKYMNKQNDDRVLELEEERKRYTDSELTEKILFNFKIHPVMIQNEPKDKKEILLKEIMQLEGVSTRQLSRVTGISVNTIWRL